MKIMSDKSFREKIEEKAAGILESQFTKHWSSYGEYAPAEKLAKEVIEEVYDSYDMKCRASEMLEKEVRSFIREKIKELIKDELDDKIYHSINQRVDEEMLRLIVSRLNELQVKGK